MNYNKMTKKELIEELQRRDKENNQLNINDLKSKKTLSFKIINYNQDKSWIYIELLWQNNTTRRIHFIEGTLKFFDENKNLLCVDNRHICDEINPYSEKAYVLRYLKRDTRIPSNASSVQVIMTNVYDYNF